MVKKSRIRWRQALVIRRCEDGLWHAWKINAGGLRYHCNWIKPARERSTLIARLGSCL